jgi:type III restriction enzyme
MPQQVVIENPVLNSPFEEPQRHFRFTDDGITDEIVEKRRVSSYFIPIAKPRKRGGQLAFDTEWTQDRVEENVFINRVRERVALWRQGGYLGISKVTRRLLDYWKRPDRERRLFFCQVEALETVIYITEVARKSGDVWIENELRRANDDANNYQSIVASSEGQKTIKPILRPYNTVGSTRHVDFDTTRPTYVTRADKCHVSHVVADTDSWE